MVRRGGSSRDSAVKPVDEHPSRPIRTASVSDRPGKAEELTRFRIVTSDGILVVYDAAIPPGVDQNRERERPANSDNPGFVAYWNDFETESLYVFDRLLFTPDDAVVAVGSLERDFGLDPVLFESDDLGVSRIPSDDPPSELPPWSPSAPLGEGGGEGTIDDGSWQPASREGILAIMGFVEEDGWVSVAAPPPWCLPEMAVRPIEPLRGRPPGASPDDLLQLAVASAVCPPSGGSCTCCVGAASDSTSNGDGAVATSCCAGGVCNDGNRCTVNDLCGNQNVEGCGPTMCCGTPKCPDDDDACTHDSCSNGLCIYAYLCDDNNACTADTCDPDVGCFHDPVDCTDPDPCTKNECDSPWGCDNGPICSSPNRPQCCYFSESELACCEADQVCCRYRWAGEGHPDNGCCPAGTTCCDTQCCQPDYVCCGGTACCLADHCCANGVCCADICNECINYGFLWGGTIAVDPAVACVGDLIRFSADGVVDSGGTERVECGSVSIQVPPTYSWIITKPDGTTIQGMGTAAIVIADLPGTYWCGFSVEAIRDCPPSPLPLGPLQALAIRAEMDPITSGVSPVPENPAIVAPMTPLSLDDFSLWWEANTFALTELEPPDVDLTTLPITWAFVTTSGFLTPLAHVVAAQDRRSAVLEIPFPSWGNLGAGRMEFRIDGNPCASVTALIKNVQPDLEPGDFRFQVKAHLCTDGQGTSTARTPAEVRAIMSDVTKVLSQCGIIVTLSEVVTTTVSPAYMRLDSVAFLPMWDLFDTDESETAIDIYFINAIDYVPSQDCGDPTGVTGTPNASTFIFEAGIAIADVSCDGPATGQQVVRTVAHEIVHYLMNNENGNADHVTVSSNLMYPYADDAKRDLDENQCLTARSNYVED